MQTEFQYGKVLVNALSNETRIDILRVLSNGSRYIGELERFFPVCKEILLQHLAILAEAKLIEMKVIDAMIHYGIHSSSVNIVQNFLANTHNTERRADALYYKSTLIESCQGY